MYYYQDLETISETGRGKFCADVVAAHRGTEEYHVARDAEDYYEKRNPTISKFQKMIVNTLGEKVPDMVSANYKLTHGFFRRFVTQQVQFVTANGVNFNGKQTKEKLGGNKFDRAISRLATKAMIDGVAFGFWNYDHLEIFSFVDTRTEPGFAPLYDADTGMLRAGVRYWYPSEDVSRYTLYETDGSTEYIKRDGEEIKELSLKKPYKTTVKRTAFGGVEEIVGANYDGFPIMPMYANDSRISELCGIRSSIDCYDFISSGMANAIDETSLFYWIIEGSGGVDDVDLVEFVNRMKNLKATYLPPDTKATANTMNIPVEANNTLLDRLKDDMYEDMMLMNPSRITDNNVTATAINMAYAPQEDKCGEFEYCIRDFIEKLLVLVGIEDDPEFKWNKVANQTEEVQKIMLAAQYLPDDMILELLPFLTPEMVERAKKMLSDEDVNRMLNGVPDDGNDDDENGENEPGV